MEGRGDIDERRVSNCVGACNCGSRLPDARARQPRIHDGTCTVANDSFTSHMALSALQTRFSASLELHRTLCPRRYPHVVII